MLIRFDNKTVIVTGAAHGFGRAIAFSFAALGAQVVACDLLKNSLEETARLAAEQGNPLRICALDVSDAPAVHHLVEETLRASGQVDILVNNAGGVMGQVGRPLEEVSAAEWKTIFASNLDGTFYCSQAVAPAMKARRYGRIINISSGAGLGVSLTGIQAYASAKAGQIGLTRQLAHELGPWNITVNSIAPGFVRSNPTTEKQWQSYGSEGQKRLIENIALRLRIPLKAISHSGGKPITIPGGNRSGVGAKRRWHFDVAKTDRNRQVESVQSEAKEGWPWRGWGAGQGAAVPCPRLSTQ